MKVLLIHASLGAGHKRAAQALLEALQQRGIEAEIQDLLSFLPAPLARFYSWAYNFMINDWRRAWRIVYKLTDQPHSAYSPARSILQKWQFLRLKEYLQKSNFTHIFSTHFTTSALLTDWRQLHGWSSSTYSIVTDYTAHRCWKRAGLDHYFVPSPQVAEQLNKSGIPLERITVSGIPISPAFSMAPDRNRARMDWACKPEDTALLVLCSGLNYDKTICLLCELAELEGSLRFLVSTGSDPVKETKVRNVFTRDTRFTIFGFSPRIAEMMSSADLIITKPGGLIVTEALAMGLPQLLLPAIPGQEEANANYAVQNGAALHLSEKEGTLKQILRELLSNPQRRSDMSRAARAAGKPDAAFRILELALRS